jgi:hypothetical protein
MTQAREATKAVEPLPERTKHEETQPDENVRLHPFLHLQRAAGNQAVLRLVQSQGHFQPDHNNEQARGWRSDWRFSAVTRSFPNAGSAQLKAVISSRNDPAEAEADEIAERVMELPRTMNSQPPKLANRTQSPLVHTASNPPALQRQAKAGDGAALTAEEPSPRALMLFEMFDSNRAKFKKGFSDLEFSRERREKDAKEETLHVKMGAINWTYVFVTNEKSGAMYVRQSQDGTPIVNIYQLIDSNLSMTQKFEINFNPDTADYVDEKAAITELTRLATLLKSSPELIITISGNMMGKPDTEKGNSPAELAKVMTIGSTVGELMLARARRVQETLEKDFKLTNVIIATTGSVINSSDGLKIFITVSGANK